MDDTIDLSFLGEREKIEKKDFHRYRTIELPKTGHIKVRPLSYGEVKQLNEFNRDNFDSVYDSVILASTDLTENVLYAMDSIEREYLLLHMRSMSFINPVFEFEMECDKCQKNQPCSKSIEEFAFESPVGIDVPFFVNDGFGEVEVHFRLQTYGDEMEIASAYGSDDLRKELFVLASVIDKIIVGDEVVYKFTTPQSNYQCVNFLSENGAVAMAVTDKVDSFVYGLQPVVEEWKCRYCDHDNLTEVDPTDFLYSLS